MIIILIQFIFHIDMTINCSDSDAIQMYNNIVTKPRLTRFFFFSLIKGKAKKKKKERKENKEKSFSFAATRDRLLFLFVI